MDMEQTLQIFGDIGNVLGYPAMLLIFWLYIKVKDIEKRLSEGTARFDRMDTELKEINKSLGVIIGEVKTIVSIKTRSHQPDEQ